LGGHRPNAFPTGTTDNLVYVPIAPCRVVDTRGTGARTGMIPNNGTRSFDLELDAFTSGQGGAAACAGLPSFSHYGWAANVTVTGYSAVGGLKAWGFSAPEPNASIINFAPGSFALANGLILTGCYGCVDDITIRAFGSATHVIIDVMGYFRQAQTSTAAVTRVAGTAYQRQRWAPEASSRPACVRPARAFWRSRSTTPGRTRPSASSRRHRPRGQRLDHQQRRVRRSVTVYARCMDTPIQATP
jgi:hypothetical protein